MITPEERHRRDFQREQRRDAGVAFVVLACLLVLLIGCGMLLIALIEGKL